MAANRVLKEYKELNREMSRSGGDKEISLAPLDDASIFEWKVRRARAVPCDTQCFRRVSA